MDVAFIPACEDANCVRAVHVRVSQEPTRLATLSVAMMQRLFPGKDHPVKARAVHHLAVAGVSRNRVHHGLILAKEYQAMCVGAVRARSHAAAASVLMFSVIAGGCNCCRSLRLAAGRDTAEVANSHHVIAGCLQVEWAPVHDENPQRVVVCFW